MKFSTNLAAKHPDCTDFSSLNGPDDFVDILGSDQSQELRKLGIYDNVRLEVSANFDSVVDLIEGDSRFVRTSTGLAFSGKSEPYYIAPENPSVMFHIRDYSLQIEKVLFVYPTVIILHPAGESVSHESRTHELRNVLIGLFDIVMEQQMDIHYEGTWSWAG